jgi:hypothetical protein
MAAAEAGDYTALIEGCGNQLVQGYTYCRVREGDPTSGKIKIVVPPTQCKRPDACAFYKIYFPDGSPSIGGAIPKGETSAEIMWSDIAKKPIFSVGDRGFWPFTTEIYWLDPDGNERMTFAEGEMRMRVYRKEYEPLNQVQMDSNFVWMWEEKGVFVKSTTGARSYVSKKK